MKVQSTRVRVVKGDVSRCGAVLRVNVLRDRRADETRVRRACRAALNKAEKLRLGSVAFSALNCKGGSFPLKASAKIMAQEVLKHLRDRKSALKEILFCASDKEGRAIFNQHILGYLDYIINKLKSPFVTVDAIIELKGGIVLIRRSNPPFGWALPGGFVDYGESLEKAVAREVKEETNLTVIALEQFHTYSDPGRDPRFHTVGTVFIAKVKGEPKAGDDAAALKVVTSGEIARLSLAFDHKEIVLDYLRATKRKF